MNRVVIQEGYSLPVSFDGTRRRRSSGRRPPVAQQNKMKACAKKWNGKGKYTAFMKKCLKK